MALRDLGMFPKVAILAACMICGLTVTARPGSTGDQASIETTTLYQAYNRESGLPVGLFVQVDGRLTLTPETSKRLDPKNSKPNFLEGQAMIGKVAAKPCGGRVDGSMLKDQTLKKSEKDAPESPGIIYSFCFFVGAQSPVEDSELQMRVVLRNSDRAPGIEVASTSARLSAKAIANPLSSVPLNRLKSYNSERGNPETGKATRYHATLLKLPPPFWHALDSGIANVVFGGESPDKFFPIQDNQAIMLFEETRTVAWDRGEIIYPGVQAKAKCSIADP